MFLYIFAPFMSECWKGVIDNVLGIVQAVFLQVVYEQSGFSDAYISGIYTIAHLFIHK